MEGYQDYVYNDDRHLFDNHHFWGKGCDALFGVASSSSSCIVAVAAMTAAHLDLVAGQVADAAGAVRHHSPAAMQDLHPFQLRECTPTPLFSVAAR